jgi:hypothetical protein
MHYLFMRHFKLFVEKLLRKYGYKTIVGRFIGRLCYAADFTQEIWLKFGNYFIGNLLLYCFI